MTHVPIRFSQTHSPPGWRGVAWETRIFAWSGLEFNVGKIFADPRKGEGNTMKRKRGPAPQSKKSRLKPQHKDLDPQSSSEEWNGVSGEEDDFEGFLTDEEEGGQVERAIEDDNGVVAPVNGSTSQAKKRGKKAAPTQEELMELLFRSSSFQSNLFKLQVDELLSEIRLKYEKMEKVETILHKLKDILMHLPESEEQSVFPPLCTGLKGSYIPLNLK